MKKIKKASAFLCGIFLFVSLAVIPVAAEDLQSFLEKQKSYGTASWDSESVEIYTRLWEQLQQAEAAKQQSPYSQNYLSDEDAKKQGAELVKSLPNAVFTGTPAGETDPAKGWNASFSISDWNKSEMSVVFFINQETTLNDIYFSSNFTGYRFDITNGSYKIISVPTNLKVVIEHYTTNTEIKQKAVLKAAVYNVPGENPLVYNAFKQVTGVSGANLTLPRGVYRARVTPLETHEALVGNTVNFKYGVAVTGSDAVILYESLNSLGNSATFIDGINAGKTIAQINSDVAEQLKFEAELHAMFQQKYAKEREAQAKAQAAAQAAKPITLKINGVTVKTDSPPVIENGRTLAPLRATVEALGYIVSFNSGTQTIEIYDPVTEDLRISLKVGSNRAKVSTGIYGVMDEQILDVPAKAINGRTMVPVRFIAQNLGCQVKWDEKTRTINIVQSAG